MVFGVGIAGHAEFQDIIVKIEAQVHGIISFNRHEKNPQTGVIHIPLPDE